MYLEAFADNPYATNCWLLALEGRDEAVVVDPGFEGSRVLRLLEGASKRPVAVLATHGHFDHVGAAAEIGVPCYVHEADRLAFVDPEAWGAGFPTPVGVPDDLRTFVEGDVLDLAGFSLEVMHTPGHTPGSSCFRAEDVFFSGDLVFRGAIGRYDLPNSSADDMYRSLGRFLTLPDELGVHPGHGEDTTVGRERATNPFLLQLA